MNKMMIFLNVVVILSIVLAGCAGQGEGGGDGGGITLDFDGGDEGAVAADNTLIYILIGAIVLVAVVALLKR